MEISFRGMKAAVTGGASGIGLACARALAESGATVWVLDRSQSPEFAATSLLCDVTDPASVEAAFERIGTPHVVIANAGVAGFAGIEETSRELWDRTLAVNLTGVFHTVQSAARRMKPAGGGSIVITASTNSYDGEAGLTAYNATKAGVLGILHTAANELGPHGIRVNAVCPGMIRTPLTRESFAAPEFLREYFRPIALGRGGEPEEVANAVAFLASPLASYITGAALLVDGGQMASKFSTWKEDTAIFEAGRWRLKEPSQLK